MARSRSICSSAPAPRPSRIRAKTSATFRIRLSQSTREKRDDLVEQLRQKYAPKVAALQERIRKAQEAVEREKAQADQQKMQTAISFGATLLGALGGRKINSSGNIGKATTPCAARAAR